jgi:lysophospholipase L1-like esterase
MNKHTIVIAVIAFAVFSVAAQTKIACIGNSITYGYGLSSPGTQSYPPLLRQLLGTTLYTVQNDGVNSLTMSKKGNLSYWTNGLLAQVFALQPAIVTIMLGTNDTKPQNWDSLGRGTQFKTDYLAMVDTLAAMASHPKIYVTLPVPVFSNPIGAGWGIRDSVIKKIIPLIKEVAVARSLTVIDCNTPLLGFPAYFSADGVHPDARGEDTIAHVIYRALIATSVVGKGANPSVSSPGNCRTPRNMVPVFNGSSMSALFAGLKAGQQYEFRIFDARGVMTEKIPVDVSPASQNAVRKTLAKAAGMRLVEVKKL